MSQTSVPWLADVTQAAVSVPAVVGGALAALLVLLCVVEVSGARRKLDRRLIRVVLGVIVSAASSRCCSRTGSASLPRRAARWRARASDLAARGDGAGSPLGLLTVDAGDAIDKAREGGVRRRGVGRGGGRLSMRGSRCSRTPGVSRRTRRSAACMRWSNCAVRWSATVRHRRASLTVRNGCTAVRCDALALFAEPASCRSI